MVGEGRHTLFMSSLMCVWPVLYIGEGLNYKELCV